MIGQVVSHYKIIEKLGEGGMGVVYRAEDTRLKRLVALKFLPHGLEAHEAERARFLQEAQAAAALNHPNICTIHDITTEGDQQFIVMEYVDGETLRKKIEDGRLKIENCVTFAIQIGEALQEAHSKGIVHRDIKTSNIMVNTKNQVKVMDFGLAKLKGSLKLTKTSSTVGTLAYMAPEQILGGEVDARSDIFSFGVVLYEMLTGHLPFRGEHEAAMVYSIVNEEPAPIQKFLPDISSELVHILSRALEKDPEDRYQSVHDMVIDLRRLKKETSRVSRQTYPDAAVSGIASPVTAPSKLPSRKKIIWIGGAVVLLAAIALTVFLLKPRTLRPNPNPSRSAFRLPFREVGYPSLSRDGNWIAFPAKDEKGGWDLYLMNASSGTPRRLTHETLFGVDVPELSPDVSQVVYEAWTSRTAVSQIRIVASQGGTSRTLAENGRVPEWSPDGQRVGYLRGGDPFARGIWEFRTVRPDGTGDRLEFVDSVSVYRMIQAFCWSPDGASIAWVRHFPEGYSEVMVRNLATGVERQITSDRSRVDEVVWLISGQLLFTSAKSGQSGTWMVSSEGGEPIPILQGTDPIVGAKVSADSRTLVYIQREQISQVWLSDINGGKARQVTSGEFGISGAAFSPDGKLIAYRVGSVDVLNPQAQLFTMDRFGANQRPLTSGLQTIQTFRWSPDGKWIAYSSREIHEPADSVRVFLISPLSPGPPRLLCSGLAAAWIDNARILVWRGMKSFEYSVSGESRRQVCPDSTITGPLPGGRQLVVQDFRKGREGWWVQTVDRKMRPQGAARWVISQDMMKAGPRDLRFFVYVKQGDELWQIWTSTGKEQRIGKAFASDAYLLSMSWDGTELLWRKEDNRSKLVLVRNVFE